MNKVNTNGTRAANDGAHTHELDGGATNAPNGTPNSTPTEAATGNLEAAVWRIGAPDEWAYFAHLCHAVDDTTGETLERLRVSDWKHPTSALIYKSAAAFARAR